MADVSDLALLMGASTLVNTVYAVENNKDPVVPMVASGVSFVGLSIVGGVTNRYDLVTAVAWLFFFGSLLIHGSAIVNAGTKLVATGSSKAKVPASKTSSGTASNSGGATGKGSSGAGGGGGGGGAW